MASCIEDLGPEALLQRQQFQLFFLNPEPIQQVCVLGTRGRVARLHPIRDFQVQYGNLLGQVPRALKAQLITEIDVSIRRVLHGLFLCLF